MTWVRIPPGAPFFVYTYLENANLNEKDKDSMSNEKSTLGAWEKLGIQTNPLSVVPAILEIAWNMKRKLTPCLVGDTGIGKTPIVHQWCRNKGGYLRVLNFGHMTQEELSMAMFAEDASYHDFVAPKFLLDLNEQAERLGCAVLFIDEWNRGDKALVNALFTLNDERRIHNFHLHDNVLVVAAMNPSDGSYLVNEAERDPAIRKRLNFIYVTAEPASWHRYAIASGFHPAVTGFVQAVPAAFYDKAAREAGKLFPCPSNWEKVSDILHAAERVAKTNDTAKKRGGEIPLHAVPGLDALVSGQVGELYGEKFLGFLRDASTVIAPQDILKNYKNPIYGQDTAKPTSPRERVAKLLGCSIRGKKFEDNNDGGGKRIDVISNLNKAIALAIIADMDKPETYSENLAQYLTDLPAELYMAFAAGDLNEAFKAHSSPQMEAYKKSFDLMLSSHKHLQERTKRLMQEHMQIEKEQRAKAPQS